MDAAQIPDYLPIIGICGSSGAGKTTLIESLIPKFLEHDLRVAVVKHGAHRVLVDTRGKDSDRFFRAGADVALLGEEQFFRRHGVDDFVSLVNHLCMVYDLVLVEGHATTAVPKIWLLGEGHSKPPTKAGDVLWTIQPSERQVDTIFIRLMDWLNTQGKRVPLFGCLLIGGKSSRMGRPKHLIEQGGTTWIERTVRKLEDQVQQVVLSGSGEVPTSLAHLPCIPDVPGLTGPLAGLLSALRWQPFVSWMVAACDLPDIEPQALSWLKGLRAPGVRAILPDLHGDGKLEPLLAWYDFRCVRPLNALAAQGALRISALAGHPGVATPQPPSLLRGSWRNVNTPAELVGEDVSRADQT